MITDEILKLGVTPAKYEEYLGPHYETIINFWIWAEANSALLKGYYPNIDAKKKSTLIIDHTLAMPQKCFQFIDDVTTIIGGENISFKCNLEEITLEMQIMDKILNSGGELICLKSFMNYADYLCNANNY